MARRQPTPEQKVAAVERRDRFTELAQRVAEMTDADRAALVAHVGAIVTCEGRALSFHNFRLVLTQLPTASMVGEFRQWKAHGRSVKKGERGLMIWVPTSRTDNAEPTATATPSAPTTDAPAEGEAKRAGFVMGKRAAGLVGMIEAGSRGAGFGFYPLDQPPAPTPRRAPAAKPSAGAVFAALKDALKVGVKVVSADPVPDPAGDRASWNWLTSATG